MDQQGNANQHSGLNGFVAVQGLPQVSRSEAVHPDPSTIPKKFPKFSNFKNNFL